MKQNALVLWFDEVTNEDVPLVGGKIASLGEMIQKVDVPIPPGFATTSKAYRLFIEKAEIEDKIKDTLSTLDPKSVTDLENKGKKVREIIKRAPFPKELEEEILKFYRKMKEKTKYVAVRSSATAEDLPGASFAGQQETFLNVKGEEELLEAVKNCMASLFTDRAIHYRIDKGFDHFKVSLAVGVQAMVESECSGVIFTLDPDSGFDKVVYITGGWGLGELVVQGEIKPDYFYYFKPTRAIIDKGLGDKEFKLIKGEKGNIKMETTKQERNQFVLKDEEAKELAEYAMRIESHYKVPMDIEWGKDKNGKLFILQARPETVQSQKNRNVIREYILKERSEIILTGDSIGRKIGSGKAHVIMEAKNILEFKPGDVLVTVMTDPDWEPVMKIAAAIITDEGGKTSHAAIVSRELGIPAVIGTYNGTNILKTGQEVTVDCTEEIGRIWKGHLDFEIKEIDVENVQKTRTQIMMNVGVPEQAFDLGQLPMDGVGLARQEFIISSHIGEHPLAMMEQGRDDEYLEKLAYGIAKIAASFYPRPVIVRLSDFKTNEYANLKGGKKFEPVENNPMIGWRGASRYISKKFEPAFRLECKALKRVRDEMGLINVKIMVPFCRTLYEAEKTMKIMEEEGLKRGVNDLELYVMAEIPSNVVLAKEFSQFFDGFSIGSNDLTQLTLGIDRDSEMLSKEFDERDPAVKKMVQDLIQIARENGRKVGICGQAPSEYPEFVEFLLENKIDSISVNPDVALKTKLQVEDLENKGY